jgi:hypothetical protein
MPRSSKNYNVPAEKHGLSTSDKQRFKEASFLPRVGSSLTTSIWRRNWYIKLKTYKSRDDPGTQILVNHHILNELASQGHNRFLEIKYTSINFIYLPWHNLRGI